LVFSDIIFSSRCYHRNLGVDGGSVTFTVDVPSEGNYAVNVAYVTAATRNFSVRVNGGVVDKFEFVSSGLWCGQGGRSTVLPIELQGLNSGANTITFGVDTLDKEPLIEWISVVVV
jgi:hypothetical protein